MTPNSHNQASQPPQWCNFFIQKTVGDSFFRGSFLLCPGKYFQLFLCFKQTHVFFSTHVIIFFFLKFKFFVMKFWQLKISFMGNFPSNSKGVHDRCNAFVQRFCVQPDRMLHIAIEENTKNFLFLPPGFFF